MIAPHNLYSFREFNALAMSRQSVCDQAFIANARPMADAATVHNDPLVEHGLSATRLDDLEAGIVKLETFVSDCDRGRAERPGATKGLAVEVNDRETVLSVIDAKHNISTHAGDASTVARLALRLETMSPSRAYDAIAPRLASTMTAIILSFSSADIALPWRSERERRCR